MIDLSTKYMGLELKNPLVIGSCGLTGDVDNVYAFENKGVGAVVLKSLFEEEIIREMNANIKKMASMQFVYPETLDIYENEVVQDKITNNYLKLISDAKKKVNIPVIASINCISPDRWISFPKRVEEAGADALELNIFLLPSDMEKTAEENEKVYFDIIKEVRNQVSIPIAVKISPFSASLAGFLKKISETGINGLVLFNRFYNPDFDIENLEFTTSHILSTPEELFISLRWIALMSGKLNCSLSAARGVHDHEGMIKQLLAGADVVQVVSSIYKNGTEVIPQILTGLEGWMERKGYKTLNDFRGLMAQKQSDNPGAYERVQFMKYIKGYRPDVKFSDDI